MTQNFALAYHSPQEFMQEINPDALRSGDRVPVRLLGGTKYFFTYLSTINGDIQGRSALNGRKISINAVEMILTEHDTSIWDIWLRRNTYEAVFSVYNHEEVQKQLAPPFKPEGIEIVLAHGPKMRFRITRYHEDVYYGIVEGGKSAVLNSATWAFSVTD